jgi:hypothetical protein
MAARITTRKRTPTEGVSLNYLEGLTRSPLLTKGSVKQSSRESSAHYKLKKKTPRPLKKTLTDACTLRVSPRPYSLPQLLLQSSPERVDPTRCSDAALCRRWIPATPSCQNPAGIAICDQGSIDNESSSAGPIILIAILTA